MVSALIIPRSATIDTDPIPNRLCNRSTIGTRLFTSAVLPGQSSYHTGFDNDAPLMLPTSGRITGFAVDVLSLIGKPRKHTGVLHGLFPLAIQHRIAGHRHHMFDAGFAI
jgi:hypothetical protein